MKIIQGLSILVLTAFVPAAMAGPFAAWGTCDEGGYTGGIAVDLFRVREVVKNLHDVMTTEYSEYYECAVDPMTDQVAGELYADAATGASDTGYVVSTEQIQASRLNPWGVVAIGLGAIVLIGGIALYAKGNQESNDGTTISADNGATVNVYGDGASDSHDQTSGAQ